MNVDPAQRSQRWRFAFFIGAVFAALGTVGVTHHEMWLDEAHHWMLAAHSGSFRELLFNARYDGHPPLWHVILFVLGRFTTAPLAMQLLNVAVSTTAVVLFVGLSPFARPTAAMITFSYFVFYEYTVISRNYALLFLLLTVTVAQLTRRPARAPGFLWLFLASAVLLATSHLFGLLAAVVLGAIAWADRDTFRHRAREPRFYLAFAAFGCVLTGIFLLCIPPPDHFFAKVFPEPTLSLTKGLRFGGFAARGLLHVPDLRLEHFWNTDLVASSKPLLLIAGTASWILPGLILANSRKGTLFFYGFGSLVALFFLFTQVVPAIRYNGMVFLGLIFGRWLAAADPGRPVWTLATRLEWIQGWWRRWSSRCFASILALSVGVAAVVYAIDLRRPFSEAKAVAGLIKSQLPNMPVLVSPHTAAPPIAAYLRSPVYFVENAEFRTFCRWNTDPFLLTDDGVMEHVRDFFAARPALRQCVVVSGAPLSDDALERAAQDGGGPIRLREVARFEDTIVGAESYVVYVGTVVAAQ